MAKENLYLRKSIAQLAARLMAEDGITDYSYAKKKAGRQLGAVDNSVLPSNIEIEEELKLYHSLYLSEEQPENLVNLRKYALFTMQMLDKFNPHLTGAVLDGTAVLGGETHIHLFADSAKEVEMFLLNQDIPFDADEKSYRMINDSKRDKKGDQRKKVPIFTLETEYGLQKISVFEFDDMRTTTKNPSNGANTERLNTAGLIALLG